MRNNKVIGLINNVSVADLIAIKQLRTQGDNLSSVNDSFSFSEGPGVRLIAQEGFFFRGTYFFKDDVIRIEEVTPAIALKAAKLLSSNISNNDFTVSLFHLDSSNTKRYAIKDFENMYNSFN
jgi:hypothetical protein